jgi:hypothetical protein
MGFILCLLACGPSQPADNPEGPAPEPTSTGDGAVGSDGGGETPATWAAMDHDQKMEHMQTVVMPKMSEVFKGFDADRYGKVTCATCHGKSANQGQFDMPSADLPKLPPNGQFDKLSEEKPGIMKFMMEKVVPEMVAALPGTKAYDPNTNEGFGCYGCHQSE